MTILSVEELTVAFGGVRALSGVGIEVGEGEIVGVIGPNGAGKTTLLNAISRLTPISGGEIRFAGRAITRASPSAVARFGLGRTFQSSRLFAGMTVLENVMTGLYRRTRAGVFAAAFCTPRMREEEARAAEEALSALRFVGMEAFADRPATTLSFGQQRIVEIARALIGKPVLLLLDEPAVGLSVSRLQELDLLLRRVRDERGVTLILIEHVVRLVMGVCDRIVVLNSGIKIAEGEPSAVAADPQVIAAYLGSGFDAERRAS